jgi:hypothetical protein
LDLFLLLLYKWLAALLGMKVAERLAYWGSRTDRGKRGRPHLNI